MTDDRLPTAAQVNRVTVEHVRPEIDGGRFPIKRTIGERVDVTVALLPRPRRRRSGASGPSDINRRERKER